MSSDNTENASQEEVLNTQEIASPAPTVPLTVFQQLQARLEQLEVDSKHNRWSDAPEHNGSGSINPKRRKNLPDINHDAQCKTWRRWFSAKQSSAQDVRVFVDYLDTLLKDLHDPPGEAEIYYKIRTSIRPSIREVLDVQIIQPANCEDLLSLAIRIEKNEKTTLSPTFQPPSHPQSLPQHRRGSQPRPYLKHQGSGSTGTIQEGSTGSQRRISDCQPRASDIPRGPRGDRGGRTHSGTENRGQQPVGGTKNGQKTLVDRAETQRRLENNLCYDCGEPDHRPYECQGTGSKPDNTWESKTSDGRDNKPSNGRENKSSSGGDSKPGDGWSNLPSNGWTTWECTPQPIERFQPQKKEDAQSTVASSTEATQSPQQANLNQSRWSTTGSADVASLLD